MRKRLGRRERALAKAIAMRNDAVVRHNTRFMDEVKAEARELQTLRLTLAYNAEACLQKTHVNSRLIHNAVGSVTSQPSVKSKAFSGKPVSLNSVDVLLRDTRDRIKRRRKALGLTED